MILLANSARLSFPERTDELPSEPPESIPFTFANFSVSIQSFGASDIYLPWRIKDSLNFWNESVRSSTPFATRHITQIEPEAPEETPHPPPASLKKLAK